MGKSEVVDSKYTSLQVQIKFYSHMAKSCIMCVAGWKINDQWEIGRVIDYLVENNSYRL